jgi:tRNA 5-methylaminomethyl-2-thiouridine biosynthesis bifunctional protein
VTGAPSVDGRFHAAAWRFALDSLEALADRGLPLLRDRCGALVLATDTEEDTRQAAIAADLPLPEPFLYRVSAREASELSGVALKVGGLYFPQAGWLGPGHVCRALLDGIEVRLGAAVAGLHRKSGVWTITGPNGDTLGDADVVVIANAIAAAELAATSWLPLQARRGQVTLLPPTAPCRNLHAVLVYGGYLTPAHNGRQCLGATFDWVDDPTAPVEADDDGHRRNLADLMAVFPDLKHDPDAVLNGRAAVRCTLPDHLPAAGPVPDDAAYRRDYAELRHGHPWARYPDASYHPGLYSLVGLGARGLVAAPLAAEILVSQVMGEPWPLERDLATALHPGRFLVRDLKRVKA